MSRPSTGEVHREPLVVVDEKVAEHRSELLRRPGIPVTPRHHLEQGAMSNA